MAALMRKKHFQKRRSLSFKLEKSAAQLVFYRGFTSKLFVKGVSFSTTKEMLADAFSQFGHVTEGYGYVTFNTEEEAQKALADMNGKVLDGRVIFVDNVRPSRRYNTDAPLARQLPQPPEEN